MTLPNKGFTIGQLTEAKVCCEPIPHLSVQNLSINYHQKTILENVNLEIYKGCITALIGPSGCGKTSFLSALNRMLDMTTGATVSGQVTFNGENIYKSDKDLLQLRRRVGMIFQKPNPFPLSIYRNLALPLKEIGIKNKQLIQHKIETVLKEVGLWEEVHHQLDMTATKLSGGQQQRLCIARALVLQPEVLLMDEPCSALDPISSAVVEDLIGSLRGRYTVVIVTHNLAQAKRVANYAAFFWMQERVGKLIEFGRSQNLFEQPQSTLTAAFIDGRKG